MPDESIAGMATGSVLPTRKERVWNPIFIAVQLACCIFAARWFRYDHLPPPGYSVALIAIAAACMSVHDGMKNWQKGWWLIIMAIFLGIEFRAIRKDRWDDEQAQEKRFNGILLQERGDSKTLLGYAAARFDGIFANQQIQFKQTMKTFEATQRGEPEG
ncbi:MAG TPA: hypothetical protein VGR96_03880 [Acidobacteriaceae bacterium]|nr:hypothetical protein [Acidobacteriaceae bacterium]